MAENAIYADNLIARSSPKDIRGWVNNNLPKTVGELQDDEGSVVKCSPHIAKIVLKPDNNAAGCASILNGRPLMGRNVAVNVQAPDIVFVKNNVVILADRVRDIGQEVNANTEQVAIHRQIGEQANKDYVKLEMKRTRYEAKLMHVQGTKQRSDIAKHNVMMHKRTIDSLEELGAHSTATYNKLIEVVEGMSTGASLEAFQNGMSTDAQSPRGKIIQEIYLNKAKVTEKQFKRLKVNFDGYVQDNSTKDD